MSTRMVHQIYRFSSLLRGAVALVFLLSSAPAFAISLDEAKATGLVGESRNGYLGVVSTGNAEAARLVELVADARARNLLKQRT